MSVGFFDTLKRGQAYGRAWPAERTLFALFPDPRIIAATNFGIKFMPPVSVAIVCVMLISQHPFAITQGIAMGLFTISLPIQGLYWLGVRAKSDLPPQTVIWYREIYQKMADSGCDMQTPDDKPTYMSLARLLKTAFSQLDASFRKEWF